MQKLSGGDGRAPGAVRAERPGTGPIPIWRSRMYRQGRAQAIAHRLRVERQRRLANGAAVREKRAFAEHLLDVCERAEETLQRRGGDIVDDLECIQDLQLVVSTLDAEGGTGDPERLEEARTYLKAMVLAIEVARVAGDLQRVPE
jgi:hypothetical protein